MPAQIPNDDSWKVINSKPLSKSSTMSQEPQKEEFLEWLAQVEEGFQKAKRNSNMSDEDL
jgi:hypothetical protein